VLAFASWGLFGSSGFSAVAEAIAVHVERFDAFCDGLAFELTTAKNPLLVLITDGPEIMGTVMATTSGDSREGIHRSSNFGKPCQPNLDRPHPHPKCRCSRCTFHLSVLLSHAACLSRAYRPLQWATWGQDAPTDSLKYMRPVNAANDGASFRPLAENTEAMRRWSSGGGGYRRVA